MTATMASLAPLLSRHWGRYKSDGCDVRLSIIGAIEEDWGEPWRCWRLVDPIRVWLLLAAVVDARDVFFNSSDDTETNIASI